MASCGKLKRIESTAESRSRDQGSTEIAETIVRSEKVDTLVLLPPIERQVDTYVDPAQDTSFIPIDTPEQRVEITYDPIARKIRTKAIVKERQVPVTIERTEVITRKTESDYKSETRQKEIQKEITKTKPLIPWWSWIIALVLFFAGIFLRYRWKDLTG